MTLPEPPSWIPRDAWDGYVAMRQQKKGAAIRTLRTYQLCIRKLEQFKQEGHDLEAILDRSTEMCWTGLFAPERPLVMKGNGDGNSKKETSFSRIFARYEASRC